MDITCYALMYGDTQSTADAIHFSFSEAQRYAVEEVEAVIEDVGPTFTTYYGYWIYEFTITTNDTWSSWK